MKQLYYFILFAVTATKNCYAQTSNSIIIPNDAYSFYENTSNLKEVTGILQLRISKLNDSIFYGTNTLYIIKILNKCYVKEFVFSNGNAINLRENEININLLTLKRIRNSKCEKIFKLVSSMKKIPLNGSTGYKYGKGDEMWYLTGFNVANRFFIKDHSLYYNHFDKKRAEKIYKIIIETLTTASR